MEKFRTPDTSLAAYLYQQKEKFLAVELENGRGFFVFERSGTLSQHILEFSDTSAAKQYYESYRLMLRLLNNEIKSNGNNGAGGR